MCRPAYAEKEPPDSPPSSSNNNNNNNRNNASQVDPRELQATDTWLADFDHVGFAREMRALGKELEAAQGPADVAHLERMIFWSNACAAVGLLTAGLAVNLVTIVGLSVYTTTRWTMIAHHTCHGGYENCHPQAVKRGRWSRFTFALGSVWRRFNDWFDWMLPEAWNIEHNNRHHYNLSELNDPDLVERNAASIRESKMPMVLKYLKVLGLAATWKFYYYAPNTYKELKLAQRRKQGQPIPKDADEHVTIWEASTNGTTFFTALEFWSIVVGPYLLIHFILTPAVYYMIGNTLVQIDGLEWTLTGAAMFRNALINFLWAELLTNVHSFCVIVPNHAGDDMYRFREPCRPFSGSFYLRQVIASVDMSYGNDFVDFLHGWLNYQIEHHLWPNLSMLQYQKSAPRVREICAKYGVPYIQENSFTRVRKTVDIMVGRSSMRWFPASYEKHFLHLDTTADTRAPTVVNHKDDSDASNNNNIKNKAQ